MESLVAILLILVLAMSLYIFRTRIRPPLKGDPYLAIVDAFELMRRHLGHSFSVSGTLIKDRLTGITLKWEVDVECRKCGQKNRLIKGVLGAGCAKCHQKFASESQEQAGSQSAKAKLN